jgi:steroid 5-alpha reductase family enzyme
MISLLLIGLVVAMSYFFVVWLICVRIKNYGLLDVAWSYGVAILAPIYVIASLYSREGVASSSAGRCSL